ncbi:MAG TPA: hypothetical protein DIT64_11470 [Verrucomicrobiales bacterium]|nr:hypothetical protein [Verrucomicrobiales bacterium]
MINIRSPVTFMKLLMLLLLTTIAGLTGCSTYPFGHSHNGSYYGGQGSRTAPGTYVPKELRREHDLF